MPETILCPVDRCPWTLDATPPQVPDSALAAVFGIGVFAQVAANQHAGRIEEELERHLNAHAVVDFVRTITKLRRDRDEWMGRSAAVVPGWASPAALHDAYVEAMERWQRAEAAQAEAERERDDLRYERRLLGMARSVLDLAADGESHGYDADYIHNQAADVAQRIVDEIGHPVTDEPALGPSFREQLAEAQATVDAYRQFVAQIRAVGSGSTLLPPVTLRQLVAGLDASLAARQRHLPEGRPAEPDTAVPKKWPPTGYLCVLGGKGCPGHPSKWMVCNGI